MSCCTIGRHLCVMVRDVRCNPLFSIKRCCSTSPFGKDCCPPLFFDAPLLAKSGDASFLLLFLLATSTARLIPIIGPAFPLSDSLLRLIF
ncbi:unnamed protein product [Pseudo-nitzschia multistriata]|uniref:Uncharacterized protein n=1 Tax=Pseudo-nitzschia multistriata TaxID=183589 RepID=A0A448ZR91_9STRA|nr:unnamed protein product [Pseudo-nitzschia multistriata]